jgi:hypothetical protein
MHYVITAITSQDLWNCTSAIGTVLIFPPEFLASTIPLLCFVLNKHLAAILVYQPGHISPTQATSCSPFCSPSVETSVLQACILSLLPINRTGLSGNGSYLHAGLCNLRRDSNYIDYRFSWFPSVLKASTGTVPKLG